ncbi:MAG: protein kinase, partial [Acidobacteriota bacterium]
MALAPGSKLGPYEILELIGKGGMGEVYRAHDPRLRRDVAIKTSALRFGERFEREARAVAALNHPNICQVYDVGPDYLVMELIEGPTLKDRIKEGAIPLEEALKISEHIAEALAAAHAKLITHRDLKPGNVKVKDDGTVKVLDFGLAKIGGHEATAGEDSPTVSMTLTQAGMVLGTAAYMSPEQARGKPVDARADIWAFGVVLYEMLTARRLFRGEDLTETLASVVKEQPNLSAIPHKVRRLLVACLQKDPKQRLQSIGDRHLLLAKPEVQRTSLAWPAVAAAIAIAAAALAWIHFRETPPLAQNLRYQLTRPSGASFYEFQLSPDGRYLAYTQPTGNTRLRVRAMDSLEEREFPNTDGTSYPFWSPDSRQIAFFSGGKLRRVPVGGGPPTTIAEAPDARGGAWGADGTIVFAPAPTGTLSRVPAAGGTPTEMKPPGVEGRYSLRFPAFIQDTDHFLFTCESDKREGEAVYVGSLNGDAPARLLPDLSATRFVPVSGTNGFILFRRATTLMAQPFDAAGFKTTGDAFPLVENVPDSGNTSNVGFTVSSNGMLIYETRSNTAEEREITWLDRSGKRGKAIVKQKGITMFAMSPDRTQLAYSLANQRTPGDLWLHDVARGVSQRFTFGAAGAGAYAPLWSPDSSGVIFTSYPADKLFRRELRSSAPEVLFDIGGVNTYATSWSRDKRFIVYTQTGRDTKDDLWILPLEPGAEPKPFRQTASMEHEGQVSPEGLWMMYSSDTSGRSEIYVEPISPAGPNRQVSVDGGVAPRWRADGRE